MGPQQLFPTNASLRPVSPLFTEAVAALANEEANFMAHRIVPPWGAGEIEKTGTIMRGGNADNFSYGGLNTTILPGGKPVRPIGIQPTPVTFATRDRALETVIDVRAQQAAQWDYETAQVAADYVKMLIEDEIELANTLGTIGNWNPGSFSLAAGDRWTAVGSNPVANFLQADALIRQSGRRANTVVVSGDGAAALRNNAALTSFGASIVDNNLYGDDRIKALLSAITGAPPERVFLAEAVSNTAGQGLAAVLAQAYAGFAWVGVVESGPRTIAVQRNQIQTAASALLRLESYALNVMEYEEPQSGMLGARVYKFGKSDALLPLNTTLGVFMGTVV